MITAIAYIDGLYDDPNERAREWKNLAEKMNIPIVEDEQLKKERFDREMAKVLADFGDG